MATPLHSEDPLPDSPRARSPTPSTKDSSTPPELSQQKQKEWKTRLESLQTQHQLEIFQQQEEHLRQLHSLQAQLLLELSGAGDASTSSSLLLLTGMSQPPTPSSAARESHVMQAHRETNVFSPGEQVKPLEPFSQLCTSETVPSSSPCTTVHSTVGSTHPSSCPVPNLHQVSFEEPNISSSQLHASDTAPSNPPGTTNTTHQPTLDLVSQTCPPRQTPEVGLSSETTFDPTHPSSHLVSATRHLTLSPDLHPSLPLSQEQTLLDTPPSQSLEFLQLPTGAPLARTSSTDSVSTASVLEESTSQAESRPVGSLVDVPVCLGERTMTSEQSHGVQQISCSQLSESVPGCRTTIAEPLPSSEQDTFAGSSHSQDIVPNLPAAGIYTTPHKMATVSVSYAHSPLLASSLHPPPITPLTPSHALESRTSLIEKHMKHVEDLKQYYESELSVMREQLSQLQQEAAAARRQARSPLPVSLLSPVKSGSRRYGGGNGGDGNTQLKAHCSDLQSCLDTAESEKRILEDEITRLQEYTLEWRERCVSAEQVSSVLQESLEEARAQLRQRDSLVGQLQADLQATSEELHFLKEQRTQDMERMDQLFQECGVLRKENRDLQTSCSSTEEELRRCNQEVTTLRAMMDRYKVQETQHKSTIHHLEDEVRSLQHINNRLHSQATHYELGSTIRSPRNRPDEDKLYHSPRAPSASSRRDAVTTVPSSSPQSPLVSATPTPHNQTLTRKKWLEPSDPGLILGATPTYSSPGSARTKRAGSQTEKEALRSLSTLPRQQTKIEPTPSEAGDREGYHSTPILLTVRKDTSLAGGGDTPAQLWSYQNELNHTTSKSAPGRASFPSPPLPSVHDDRRDVGSLADSTLESIRLGNIVAGKERGGLEHCEPNETYRKHRGQPNDKKQASEMSIEDRVQRHMQMVTEAEQQLTLLHSEREKLESALQRAPKSGGRITLQAKQNQFEMEKRLDEVIKEIGSVRMVLRNHNAL